MTAIANAAIAFPFQHAYRKRKGDTADANQMIMKADTVIAPNRPSRAVFELGSVWRTVTLCFPAAAIVLTNRRTKGRSKDDDER